MPADSTSSRKILIVEDIDDERELYALALTAAGYEVAATGDSAQAVEIAATREPDLVLCDIMMPQVDGYQVLRALQSDPRTRRFPVVFVTGRTGFNERVRAFRFGVVDFITKPIDPPSLVARIESVLDGLSRRGGVAEATGDGVPHLVEDVKRHGRTGVLTFDPGTLDARVVVHDGRLLAELPALASRSARFEELDAGREDLVSHGPRHLADAGPLPDFGLIPEPLREVIVADDNAPFRASFAEILTQRGFRVREAEDGEDLVRQALDRPPWLLVIDVRMPLMDGFTACRRLRAHVLTRHVPIVFLSGWDDLSERAAALDAGADEFLSKRTSIREMLLRIQVLMRRYTAGEKTRGAILEGRIDVVGAPAALQMCHLLGLTGTLEVNTGEGRIAIGFVAGRITTATSSTGGGRNAVFEFLSVQRGRFAFAAGPPEPGFEVGDAVPWLVLEGCRRIDEKGFRPDPS